MISVPLPAWVRPPVPVMALAAEVGALRDGVAAVERQVAVVGDGAGGGQRAGGAAVADLQRAGADDRSAGVGVGAGEDQHAAAALDQAAGAAADGAADGQRAGAGLVEVQFGSVAPNWPFWMV